MTEEEKQLIRDNSHLPAHKLGHMVNKCPTVVRRFLTKEKLNNSQKKNHTYEKYKGIISPYNGKSGVYIILNQENHKFYIGVADDVGVRLKQHCLALGTNKHKNKKLQEDHNDGHNLYFETLFLGDIYEAYNIEADLIMLSFGEQECYNQTPVRQIPKLSKEFINIFQSRQEKCENGCIEYTGKLDKYGYGQCEFKRQHLSAHRLSYFLHYKQDPYSLHVCHSCDNRKCVNPKHLSLGTNKDNASDRNSKGRNNSIKKVNKQVLKTILKMQKDGLSDRDISKELNLHHTTIKRHSSRRVDNKIPQETILKIYKYYQNGMKKENIAQILNISKTSVRKYINEYNTSRTK